MKIYVRKLFPHDITHEVSVTTDIVSDFFDKAHSMSFKGKKSGTSGNVTINNATDPRFGGAFKQIMANEGNPDVDDLIVIYKTNSYTYEMEICSKTDERYKTFFGLFLGKDRHVVFKTDDDLKFDEDDVYGAENILLYGVPGAGKSHTIKTQYCNDTKYMERVVFHPDYTYSDFVGQILPALNDEGKLEYKFVPGPFTKILGKALKDTKHYYYLIIEELNRGNAPAIFGEIFQLLDRYDAETAASPFLVGSSEYGIVNFDIARELFNDEEKEIKIPSNLYILATMNTADQNVFTMDTAFQRRWNMKQIDNDFDLSEHSNDLIEGTKINWGAFATTINDYVVENNMELASSEDKRLGVYFAKLAELKASSFPEKVLKYLWDDAFKMDKTIIFKDEYHTLSEVVSIYKQSDADKLASVMRTEVYAKMLAKMAEESEKEE